MVNVVWTSVLLSSWPLCGTRLVYMVHEVSTLILPLGYDDGTWPC